MSQNTDNQKENDDKEQKQDAKLDPNEILPSKLKNLC